MKLSRSLTGFLSPANSNKRWDLINSVYALQYLPFVTERVVRTHQKNSKPPANVNVVVPIEPTTTKASSELPRPSLIPFQAKVANSVNLVGSLNTDIKLHELSDGSYASVSILVNENMEIPRQHSHFRIPIIFRGDLAEIAACHLKKNDLIYVSGQLTGDNLSIGHDSSNKNIKLIVHSLNLVTNDGSPKKAGFVHKQDEVSTSDSGDMKVSDNKAKSFWDDLVIDSQKWRDDREGKLKGLISTESPDFNHMETGNVLWLDTAPDWVIPKLDGLVFHDSNNLPKPKGKYVKSAGKGDMKESDNNAKSLWDDLVIDSQKWRDDREGKLKGLISSKSPDFNHIETGNVLWQDTAPGWVIPKLDGLVFYDSNNLPKPKGNYVRSGGKDHLWEKFIENPKQWWDNRLTKFKPTQPDFRHKDDGEALWLNSAPSWVLPKLPPLPK